MRLETSRKSLEESRFGWEGTKKETWEKLPLYSKDESEDDTTSLYESALNLILNLIDDEIEHAEQTEKKYNFTYDDMKKLLKRFREKAFLILEKDPWKWDELFEKAKKVCSIAKKSFDELPEKIDYYIKLQQIIIKEKEAMIDAAKSYSLGDDEVDFINWIQNKYIEFLKLDIRKFEIKNLPYIQEVDEEFYILYDQFEVLDDLIDIIEKFENEINQINFSTNMLEIKQELINMIKYGEVIDKQVYIEKISSIKEQFQKEATTNHR